MAEERNIRIEDDKGNSYYPHAKAKTTFMSDGKTVEDTMKDKIGTTGGIFTGDVDFDYNILKNSIIKTYFEPIVTLTGAKPVIRNTDGNVFIHTLSANASYTFSTQIPRDSACSLTLIIKQPSTVYSVTFPKGIKWGINGIPDLSLPNKEYVLTFILIDDNWKGLVGDVFNVS